MSGPLVRVRRVGRKVADRHGVRVSPSPGAVVVAVCQLGAGHEATLTADQALDLAETILVAALAAKVTPAVPVDLREVAPHGSA